MNGQHTVRMGDVLDRLLRLWAEPPGGDDAAAVAAFRELYADPVPVNGAELTAIDLLGRARALHRAFDGLRMELVDRVEAPDRLVVGFRMRGRHVGPLATPLGTVAPTGREVESRVIDILTLQNGLIPGIFMVADDLGLLTQLGAVALA
jgi:Ser/Thr protein kinase RdoA (MazF antagonist)